METTTGTQRMDVFVDTWFKLGRSWYLIQLVDASNAGDWGRIADIANREHAKLCGWWA